MICVLQGTYNDICSIAPKANWEISSNWILYLVEDVLTYNEEVIAGKVRTIYYSVSRTHGKNGSVIIQGACRPEMWPESRCFYPEPLSLGTGERDPY
jgi:hypothetical protein